MPGHGDHWFAVYAKDTEIESVIRRDLVESKRIDFYPCADIVNGTERPALKSFHADGGVCLSHLATGLILLAISVNFWIFMVRQHPELTFAMFSSTDLSASS